MTRPHYDVLVVGAGPGGSTCARRIAKAGFSVAILEKAALPRYKPCGGGVTSKALQLLDFTIDGVIERTIDVASVSFSTTRGIPVIGREIGCMVMRASFDALLARKASDAGANVLQEHEVRNVRSTGTSYEVTTSQGILHGTFLVGADGANSVVARALELRSGMRFGVAIEGEIDVSASVVEQLPVVFDFAAISGGYGYIFPKAHHLSVGVYTMNPKTGNLKGILKRYLADLSGLSHWTVRSEVGHRVPLGRMAGPLHREGAMLVGDAAGIGDPLWGEGIYYAIKSGTIAAEVAIEALNKRSRDTGTYSNRLSRDVFRELRLARIVAQLFHRLPERVLVALVRDAALADEMMAILRGNGSYHRYVRALIPRVPSLLVSRY